MRAMGLLLRGPEDAEEEGRPRARRVKCHRSCLDFSHLGESAVYVFYDPREQRRRIAEYEEKPERFRCERCSRPIELESHFWWVLYGVCWSCHSQAELGKVSDEVVCGDGAPAEWVTRGGRWDGH